MNKPIRLLEAREIECRIGSVRSKGLSLLLYKDARSDMTILDETFGPLNWKRIHQNINGSLFCTVSIYDEEKKEWCDKQDVGVPSYAEATKGEASDAFKRCCVNVGIGRELYSTPFIFVPAEKTHIVNEGGKYICKDRFSVKSIKYNKHREICGLEIVNQDNVVVYKYKDSENDLSVSEPEYITIDMLDRLNEELTRTGVSMDAVLERYNLTGVHKMTPQIFKSAMNSLKKTATKNVAA